MWQKVALILIGLGILALAGWSVQSFFISPGVPLLIKIAAGAIGLGVLVLLGVAVRDLIVKARTDKFKEVER